MLVAASIAGCSGDDDAKRKTPAPAGVITTKQAQKVPLDITRKRFEALVNKRPVRVEQQRSRRTKEKVRDLEPKVLEKLQSKFGKAKGGTITIPAQTFTCLLYRGEKPDEFGWQFCFGKAGRLEYVSTTPKV